MMFNIWGVDEERWGFELTNGIYEGTVIQVDQIHLEQVNEGQVNMDYHILSMPAHLNESDYKNDNFQTVMNEVINKFLMDAIQDYEQNRNDYTKKLS